MQRAETVTLDCILSELLPFENYKNGNFTTYSYPFCNFKTVEDIFMKLHINVNRYEMTCRAQEP